MSRKNIAAGNWKMNTNLEDGVTLAKALAKDASESNLVIIAPPFISLSAIAAVIKDRSNIYLAAQNCSAAPKGAFTGEISLDMLKAVGVEYVIVGHSERREIFNETDSIIAEKVNAVLDNDLKVIFCCGEPLSVREAENQVKYVGDQLENGLFQLNESSLDNVVIAYEPIWAIGTGVTASPQQAQDMHQEIRNMLAKKYNKEVAESISILYGGSVKPANAVEIFSQKDVDGGLVGGASLKADDFIQIIKSF